MARSAVDDLLIRALGRKRSEILARINIRNSISLIDLQSELDDLETKMLEIDPDSLTLVDEAMSIVESTKPEKE